MTPLIDYAAPWMEAQKALSSLHKAMLKKDHDAAIECGLAAIADIRAAVAAIRHAKEEKERWDALCQ